MGRRKNEQGMESEALIRPREPSIVSELRFFSLVKQELALYPFTELVVRSASEYTYKSLLLAYSKH